MSDTALAPWTPDEARTLDQCEQAIARGLQSYREMGEALITIRDGRLYRQTHGTFEDYCRERWQFTPQRAGQLIEGAAIASRIETMVSSAPTNERQVRALHAIPEDDQPAAWQLAVDTAPDGKVTAGHVQRVADAWRPASEVQPLAEAAAAWEAEASRPSPVQLVRSLPSERLNKAMELLFNYANIMSNASDVYDLVTDLNTDPLNAPLRRLWLDAIEKTCRINHAVEDGLHTGSAIEVSTR